MRSSVLEILKVLQKFVSDKFARSKNLIQAFSLKVQGQNPNSSLHSTVPSLLYKLQTITQICLPKLLEHLNKPEQKEGSELKKRFRNWIKERM